MSGVMTSLRRGLVFALAAVLVVLGVLLLPVVAVAMRPLLMVGFIVAALGAAVLSLFSPAFREWFKTVGEPEISYSGLRLATDAAAHPRHSWARFTSGGVAVGADDLVQAALGPVEAVELPSVGSRIKQGDPLFSLRRGNRSVRLRAPVSGTVVTRNEALVDRPQLINESPFADGWVVRLRADNVREEGRSLFQGKQARGWFRQEVDRLIGTVASKGAVMRTLPDGGTVVEDLYRQIDDGAWKSLEESFF
jgi:glycine cleavage system H protein